MTTTQQHTAYSVATETPETGWFMVSPKVAGLWLAANTDNYRPLDKRHVAELQMEIARGGWRPNPQPISFAVDGRLLDGQHRLTAIAQGDASVLLHVCANVPAQAENVIDIGRKRAASDVLRRVGMEHPLIVEAVARILWMRERGSTNGRINTSALAEYAIELPDLEKTCGVAQGLYSDQGRTKLLRPSSMGSFLYLAGATDLAVDMLRKVTTHTGIAAETGESALLTRQLSLLTRESRVRRESAVEELKAVCTAWQYVKAGSPVRVLRMPQSAALDHLPGIDFETAGVRRNR